MQKHALTLATALLGAGLTTACGSSKSTAPSNITYTATLAGTNEVPAKTTNGTGTFTGTLNPTTNVLTYTVIYSGLGTNVTLGHIHGPADAATNANVIVNFAAPENGSGTLAVGATSGQATGSVSLTGTVNAQRAISGDSLRKLLDAGMTYANIHTTANGGGEIRGQIHRQ
jgi:hypothetical protein